MSNNLFIDKVCIIYSKNDFSFNFTVASCSNTSHLAIKDETFSGNHCYVLDGADRNYFNVGVILKRHIVHVSKNINMTPEYNGKSGDQTFVNTLLDRAFTVNELAESSATENSSHEKAHRPLCSLRLGFIHGINLLFMALNLFFVQQFNSFHLNSQICSKFELLRHQMNMKDWLYSKILWTKDVTVRS